MNRANRKPSALPIWLQGNAFFNVYMGPPTISPRALRSRYFTASIHSLNLEAIPKAAAIHIHTSAPGPPKTSAVATPMILPVPMVAARDVISAEKGEIPPALPPEASTVRALRCSVLFRAKGSFRHGRKRVRIQSTTPVPTSSRSMGGPQTKESMVFRIWERVFMGDALS